jgi:hypothetical protein
MKAGKWKLSLGVFFSLLFLASPAVPQGSRTGVDVRLSARRALTLQISLRSLANNRATIYKSDLPWGLRDSIVLVGVISNGRYLEQWPIAGDPTPEQISLNPNDSLSGEIDLTTVFKNFDVAVTKSDVQVFWAYRAPAGLGLPRWSGGWVLIPQQKKTERGAHD